MMTSSTMDSKHAFIPGMSDTQAAASSQNRNSNGSCKNKNKSQLIYSDNPATNVNKKDGLSSAAGSSAYNKSLSHDKSDILSTSSPQHSFRSDSRSSGHRSSNDSISSSDRSRTSNGKSLHSRDCSSNVQQLLAMPAARRSMYQKLESTSVTEQLSQTCSNNSFRHEWRMNSSMHSTQDTTSASHTLVDQSYSQLSSGASQTLTPTPLHALPHSSTELSSSNPMASFSSPVSPGNSSLTSPPLSPITPLTNTITPDVPPPIKTIVNKKALKQAALSSQYIFVAAHQISEAQEHEKRNEIIEAVAKYREGVGTLLQGVQGEHEHARREGVKRKTYQYLQRAEQLLSRLTRHSTISSSSQSITDKEVLSGVGVSGLQCGVDVLRQYRVLGVTGGRHAGVSLLSGDSAGVLIAQLPQSKHTVAIKIIQKSSGSSRVSGSSKAATGSNIIPRGIQHMVPIICYHETDSAIFLVMKYISGGKLWDHISKYVSQPISPPSGTSSPSPDPQRPRQPVPHVSPKHVTDQTNVYSGRRLLVDPCQEALDYDLQVAAAAAEKNNSPAAAHKTSSQTMMACNKPSNMKSCLSEKNPGSVHNNKIIKFQSDILQNEIQKDQIKNGMSHQFKESIESPSNNDPRSNIDGQSLCDPTTYDLTTSMYSASSKFTTEGTNHLVAQSGMARYTLLDTTSCASDTTIGGEWEYSEMAMESTGPDQLKSSSNKQGINKQVLFEDCNLAGTISERHCWSPHNNDVSLTSERQTKTTPITCLGKSELNLCQDIEFYGNTYVCKSLSAEDLSVNSMSGKNELIMQHSTISTINMAPLIPREGPAAHCRLIEKKNHKDDEDDVSVGSDTLSGVSDDFSCSISINQLSDDKKLSVLNINAGGGVTSGLDSELNLISECDVSEGCKRPHNSPESAYVVAGVNNIGGLKSLCQSTSADVTVDVTLEPSATLENSLCSATLNDNVTSEVFHSALKEVHMEKLISIGSDKSSLPNPSSKNNNSVTLTKEKLTEKVQQDRPEQQQPPKKLLKSSSDELSLEKNGKKPDDERCPSEPTSLSSITLPSFSTSQVADRSGSEVASFDIEELIRNSRRLLQNVDMTLEQSKGKNVKPVPSEDSSTSIDQSELPLDSVSVGFDTPDIPSNSTRCSNISSDYQAHSKLMADNTYSSIPSIALDTSRHALNPNINENSAGSIDKALRSPRLKEPPADVAKSCQPSSNDSFITCNDDDSPSKNDSNDAKDNLHPFLSLPKDSVTSKEDSTNPSDIHTQIHLSSTHEDKDEQHQLRPKVPMLERQDHFEKSDTTKSSLKQQPDNVVDKVMKTIGITKLSNESSPLSNDSTSISGITLNNSGSPEVCPSHNDSTRQSSSILSHSSGTRTDGQFSSESTSGLKYCANPADASDKEKLIPQSIAKPEQPLSEPIYLIPEKEQSAVVNKSESSLLNLKKTSNVDASGGVSASSVDNYVTAPLQNEEAKASSLDNKLIQPNSRDSSKLDASTKDDLSSLLSNDTLSGFHLVAKQKGGVRGSTDDDTYTNSVQAISSSSNSGGTTSTSFLNKSKSSSKDEGNNKLHDNEARGEEVTENKGIAESPHKNTAKKISIMRQTPLAELLEKHWRSSSCNDRDAQDRRHLPEGLIKVWGAQIVSAMTALHSTGIVWGDFGPHNLLLGEGGCVLLTLETRWSCVERGRPAASHSPMHCKSKAAAARKTVRSASRRGSGGGVDEEAGSHSTNTTADSVTLIEGSSSTSSTSPAPLSLCSACLGYIAPELQSPLAVPTPASDWWSVGALLYHLLTGQSLSSQHPSGITSHTELYLPSHLSPEAASLLTQLLTAHPSERLGGGPTGAQEILHHPFFMEAPWPQ